MKEKLLDALMYVLEHYVDQSPNVAAQSKMIASEMMDVGFSQKKIDKAILWFADLFTLMADLKKAPQSEKTAIRIFTAWESQKMSPEARGYILYLEQIGVINLMTREMIIDRVMALDESFIEIPEVKWVALIVLFNQPEMKNELLAMEDLVLSGPDSREH